jgi:hypothetical protein
MKLKQLLREYALATYYGADKRPARLLPTGLLVARARLKYGISPRTFSQLRLAQAPEAAWCNYILKMKTFLPVFKLLIPEHMRRLSANKILFYEHCRRAGLPHVPIICRIGSTPHPVGSLIDHVTDAGCLEAKLLAAPRELFVKPIHGHQGNGAFALTRRDGGYEFDGRTGTASDLFAHLDDQCSPDNGFIIQPRMKPHAEMMPLASAPGLSTVRLITAMYADGPRALFACLKIATGSNSVDNFAHGSTGNLLAGIDVATGVMMPAVGSARPDWPAMVEVASNPENGYPIAGSRVPLWPEVVTTALRGQDSLPEFKTIGWDIAITSDGVVLVEANYGYDPLIIETAYGRGLKAEFATLLDATIE